MRLPTPPYLKQSLPYLHKDGLWVVIGSWEAAKARLAAGLPVALLPPDKAVNDFDWSRAARFRPPVIVRQHETTALDPTLLERLATTLIQAGCLRVIDPTGQRWLHPKEEQRLARIEQNTYWAEP